MIKLNKKAKSALVEQIEPHSETVQVIDLLNQLLHSKSVCRYNKCTKNYMRSLCIFYLLP